MRTVITIIVAVIATVMVMTHMEQVINFLVGSLMLAVIFAVLGATGGTGGKIVRGISRFMWNTLRVSSKLVLR